MSAARRNVLVKCGDSQKPVLIEPPWKKHQLTSVVLLKFNLPLSVPILLQIYDQDWDTYIDLEDDDDIPDRSKINCIVRPNVYSHDTALQQCPTSSTTGLAGVCVPHVPDAVISRNCNTLQIHSSSDLDSTMTETSIRLPPQRYEGTHSEPVSSSWQKRSDNTNIHCTKGEDNGFLQSSVRISGGQCHLSGRGVAFSGLNQLSNTEQEQMNNHISQLSGSDRSVSKHAFIELAEEELVPVSEEDDSVADDLDCATEVHFQALWPRPYTLPNDIFPQKLTRALENQEQLDWSLRHILVQCIADSILKYTTYPSQGMKDEVIGALFQRYPYLANCGVNGFKRWQQVLNEKFKNVRRKMTTPEVVSRKRKRIEQSSPNTTMDETYLKRSDEDSLEMSVYEEEPPYPRQESSDTSQHLTDDVMQEADDSSYQTPAADQNIQFDHYPDDREESSLAGISFPKSTLSWPTPYTLPKRLFPPILVHALENKQKLDGPKANLLIRCLSDSIQPYSIFPTVKQREEVAQCLVGEYPHLIDNSPNGWTNHYIKLSERFKNIRRKLMRTRRESESVFVLPPQETQTPAHTTSGSVDTSTIKIEVP